MHRYPGELEEVGCTATLVSWRRWGARVHRYPAELNCMVGSFNLLYSLKSIYTGKKDVPSSYLRREIYCCFSLVRTS